MIKGIGADLPPVQKALLPRLIARNVLRAAAVAAVLGLTAWTAVVTKRATATPAALANIRVISRPGVEAQGGGEAELLSPAISGMDALEAFALAGLNDDPRVMQVSLEPERLEPPPNFVGDRSVRWFNGRPIRPVRTMTMTVTAYSPDEQSCGECADGLTATLHSVTTNAHRLVASDPKVLPYGSMVSMPGYDQGRIVPVLDCGAKIKGRRLDVLFPTHQEALRWGKRSITVTIWGFADGLPAENPRKLR